MFLCSLRCCILKQEHSSNGLPPDFYCVLYLDFKVAKYVLLPAFVDTMLNCSFPVSQYTTAFKAACSLWLSQQNELAHYFLRDLSKILKAILTKLTRRPQLKKEREFFCSDIGGMANKDTKNMC